MRVAQLAWPWMLCFLAQPSCAQLEDNGSPAAPAAATIRSIDPENPNFDVATALAELKARTVRLSLTKQHLQRSYISD